MTTLTYTELKELHDTATSTMDWKKLTGWVELADFQRGLYGESHEVIITNGYGHVIAKIK